MIIGLDHIYRRLQERPEESSHLDAIAEAAGETARPVLFSVVIILGSLVSTVYDGRCSGKIFGPMSIAYGFALLGAEIYAFLFAPVLSSWGNNGPRHRQTKLVRWLRKHYLRALIFSMDSPRLVVACGAALLL